MSWVVKVTCYECHRQESEQPWQNYLQLIREKRLKAKMAIIIDHERVQKPVTMQTATLFNAVLH